MRGFRECGCRRGVPEFAPVSKGWCPILQAISHQHPGLDYEQVTSIGQEDMGIQRSTPSGLLFGAGNRLRLTRVCRSWGISFIPYIFCDDR